MVDLDVIISRGAESVAKILKKTFKQIQMLLILQFFKFKVKVMISL